MAKLPVAVRLDPALVEWLDGYAEKRGVSRQVLLESAIDSFVDDAERGVPELRAALKRQSAVAAGEEAGVGDCPRRSGALGHVFRPATEDPVRPCRFCGLAGRLERPVGKTLVDAPNHLSAASAERSALFSRLHPAMVSGAGKAK